MNEKTDRMVQNRESIATEELINLEELALNYIPVSVRHWICPVFENICLN